MGTYDSNNNWTPSPPNSGTTTAKWEGYTTYPPYYVYPSFDHGTCPTCGKCRCCDGKKEYGTWTNMGSVSNTHVTT